MQILGGGFQIAVPEQNLNRAQIEFPAGLGAASEACCRLAVRRSQICGVEQWSSDAA